MILDIKNEKGLHARASARFVDVVEHYDADAEVSKHPVTASWVCLCWRLLVALRSKLKRLVRKQTN
jgi:phosphocarrier protein